MREYASMNKYGVSIRVALRDVCDRSPGLCDYNEWVSFLPWLGIPVPSIKKREKTKLKLR